MSDFRESIKNGIRIDESGKSFVICKVCELEEPMLPCRPQFFAGEVCWFCPACQWVNGLSLDEQDDILIELERA